MFQWYIFIPFLKCWVRIFFKIFFFLKLTNKVSTYISVLKITCTYVRKHTNTVCEKERWESHIHFHKNSKGQGSEEKTCLEIRNTLVQGQAYGPLCQKYIPWSRLWPGLNHTTQDENKSGTAAFPFLSGICRQQHRSSVCQNSTNWITFQCGVIPTSLLFSGVWFFSPGHVD